MRCLLLLSLLLRCAAVRHQHADAAVAPAAIVDTTRHEHCVPVAPCCSRFSGLAYERKWTSLCVSHDTTDVEYCPLGTPYGDVGWSPQDGYCGINPSGAVCDACACCCPGMPVTASGPCSATARAKPLATMSVEGNCPDGESCAL